MPEVTIYTKRMCPYCVRARRLLRKKGVRYQEIRARAAGGREGLRRRFGASTFPQITIGERHVGGSDELVALDLSGELDELLRAA